MAETVTTETTTGTVETAVGADTASAETGAADAAAQSTDTNTEELAKVKADLARMKAALDKATKEAGDARKALRAKQSAEEIAAEEQRATEEATKKELDKLRREVARARAVKTVMGRLGTNEDTSMKIAEMLYGAEDIDAALTEIQKAWTAREKALRLEYGKIPAPGAGASEGATLTREQLDRMGYRERLDFANKYPEEYAKLMGRA